MIIWRNLEDGRVFEHILFFLYLRLSVSNIFSKTQYKLNPLPMTVKVQTFTCIWPFYGSQLQLNWRSTRGRKCFFQHSVIVKQWHSLIAYGTMTDKRLRCLYLQCFCNFLNLYLELELDLEFILKLFLVINFSDLFDC